MKNVEFLYLIIPLPIQLSNIVNITTLWLGLTIFDKVFQWAVEVFSDSQAVYNHQALLKVASHNLIIYNKTMLNVI